MPRNEKQEIVSPLGDFYGLSEPTPYRLQWRRIRRLAETLFSPKREVGQNVTDVYRARFNGERAFLTYNFEDLSERQWSKITDVLRQLESGETEKLEHIRATGRYSKEIVVVPGEQIVIKKISRNEVISSPDGSFLFSLDPEDMLFQHLYNDYQLQHTDLTYSNGNKINAFIRGTKAYAVISPKSKDYFYWIEELCPGTALSEYYYGAIKRESLPSNCWKLIDYCYETIRRITDPTLSHGYTNPSEVFVQLDANNSIHLVATDIADMALR